MQNGIIPLGLLLGGNCLIKAFVAEVDDEGGAQHAEVDTIEGEGEDSEGGPIGVAEGDPGADLAQNAADVAEEDEEGEHKARSLRRAGFIGTHEVEGPGASEENDHKDFEDDRQRFHFYTSFSHFKASFI